MDIALLAFFVGIVVYGAGYITHWVQSRRDRRALKRYRAWHRAMQSRIE